jgi:hypothetical protein
MRRLITLAVAGATLSGCASFSLDSFKSAPPPVTVQLDSIPPGADAVTSLGPGCKTPCSISVPFANSFNVTYSMARFQPATVPVTVTQIPGDFTTPSSTSIDPNPVIVELQPALPAKRGARRPVAVRRAPAPVAAAPAAASPFPAPR